MLQIWSLSSVSYNFLIVLLVDRKVRQYGPMINDFPKVEEIRKGYLGFGSASCEFLHLLKLIGKIEIASDSYGNPCI